MADRFESAIVRLMRAITRSGNRHAADAKQRTADIRNKKADVILSGDETRALREFLKHGKRKR